MSTPKSLVLANYLFFSPEGKVIAAVPESEGVPAVVGGTVGPAFKPVTADPFVLPESVDEDHVLDVNWPTMGTCLEVTPQTKVNEKDIMGVVGGRYQRTNVIPISATLDFEATLAELDEKFFQAVMVGGTIGQDSTYNPLAGTGQIRGWLKCLQYNAGTITHKFDVYVSGTVKAPKEGNNNIEAAFTFKVIASPLATGKITL